MENVFKTPEEILTAKSAFTMCIAHRAGLRIDLGPKSFWPSSGEKIVRIDKSLVGGHKKLAAVTRPFAEKRTKVEEEEAT